jgi:alpha-1,2-mannosyltransferase
MSNTVSSQTQAEMPQIRSQAISSIRPGLLRVIVVVLLLAGVLQIGLAWSEIIDSGMDIQQDFVAAQRLRAGLDIYAPILPAEVSALGVIEENHTGMRLNAHPPLTALLLVPLTFVSFPVATLIWTLGCVLLLGGMVYLLAKELDLPLASPWWQIAALLMPSWYPVWLHLHLGQFTIPLAALIFGSWYALRRGRDGLAGGLLAVAILLKIFPGLLLAYALINRRWRMLWAALAVMLALVLVQTALGPRQWPDYFLQVAPNNAATWMNNPRNASIASISMRLFVDNAEVESLFDLPAAEPPTRMALYAATLACVAAVLWRRRRAGDATGQYSLLLCTMVLLSPLSWEHSFIFLLLPLAMVWQRLRAWPGNWRRAPKLFALLAVGLSIIPSEMILLAIKNYYWPARMPSWVGLLEPNVAVVLCVFVAVAATLWNLPNQDDKGQLS